MPDFKFRLEPGLCREPFEIDTHAPIVEVLSEARRRQARTNPAWRGEPFWTDCAILAQAGIPCVLIGADGGGAHAATEWADIESVEVLTDILAATAREFCA